MAVQALVAACLLCPGLAQQIKNEPKDVPSSSDFTSVPRPPDTYIYAFEQFDSAGHEFMVSDTDSVRIEGRCTHITYFFKVGGKQPAGADLLADYRAIFEKAGGRRIWKQLDPPRATLTTWSPAAEEIWIDLVIGQDGTAGSYYDFTIVQAPSATPRTQVDADEIESSLFRFGRIALYGINFDEQTNAPTADSAREISEVEKLLKSDRALTLDIQVHTDSTGDRTANWQNSQKRADALRQLLIDRGIEAARLTADGYGDTKPVASNKDDDGRQRNRRVELVKTNAVQ